MKQKAFFIIIKRLSFGEKLKNSGKRGDHILWIFSDRTLNV